MESLYHQWEKTCWRQRWYLGMEPADIEPPPFVPDACGFWLRTLAWLTASLLMGLVTLLVLASLSITGWMAFPHTAQGLLVLTIGIILIVMILKSAYYTLLPSNNGQTIGQAVLGIKLVDTQGNPPSLRQAARRRSARFLSFITLGFGYFWMLFDPNKQTLHDKLAGTYVVIA